MAFHVRDPETDRVVRALAAREGKTLTESIRDAAIERLKQLESAAAADKRPFRERIRDIQERVAARGLTGLKADKAFYDSLYED